MIFLLVFIYTVICSATILYEVVLSHLSDNFTFSPDFNLIDQNHSMSIFFLFRLIHQKMTMLYFFIFSIMQKFTSRSRFSSFILFYSHLLCFFLFLLLLLLYLRSLCLCIYSSRLGNACTCIYLWILVGVLCLPCPGGFGRHVQLVWRNSQVKILPGGSPVLHNERFSLAIELASSYRNKINR